MKDISCLIPTWITATHALNAYKSFNRYYPDIPVFFIDDKFDSSQENPWKQIYNKGWDSYDPDSTKLIGLPNTCYIQKDHNGGETEGHANAVTYAMQFIYTKWVVHLSSDVRIVEDHFIEDMLKDVDDSYCGIGDGFNLDRGPNVGKWLCMFRGDLYHKYDSDFHADRHRAYDAGQFFFNDMVNRGYKIKDVSVNGYIKHLTSKRSEEWEQYYEL